MLRGGVLDRPQDPQEPCRLTFCVPRFLSGEEESVCSDEWWYKDVCWRLRVFPRGNEHKVKRNVAVYLELGKLQVPEWTVEAKFRVEMIHNVDSEKTLRFEARHVFTNADSELDWGFTEFVPISLLKQDPGFFSANETVTFCVVPIRIEVSPPPMVSVRLATEATFCCHHGCGLIPLQSECCFRVKQGITGNALQRLCAQQLDVDMGLLRLWMFVTRQNLTVRPHEPVPPSDDIIRMNDPDIFIFAQVSESKPPSIQSENFAAFPDANHHSLLFFKYYNPITQKEPRYIGCYYAQPKQISSELAIIMRQLAGLSPDEEINIFEEIKPDLVKPVNTTKTIFENELVNGDILVFEKVKQSAPFRTIQEWYNRNLQRLFISFIACDAPTQPPTKPSLKSERTDISSTTPTTSSTVITTQPSQIVSTSPSAPPILCYMNRTASYVTVTTKLSRMLLGAVEPNEIHLMCSKPATPIGHSFALEDMLGNDRLNTDILFFIDGKTKSALAQSVAQMSRINVEPGLECLVCRNPLVNPVIHTCGEMMCLSCAHKGAMCSCASEINDSTISKVVPKYVHAKLKSLCYICTTCKRRVPCESRNNHIQNCPDQCENGCGLRVSASDRDSHRRWCPRALTTCPTCSVSMPYGIFVTAHNTRCQRTCANEGCATRLVLNAQERHDQTCPKKLVPCPQCKKLIPRSFPGPWVDAHCTLCPRGCGEYFEGEDSSIQHDAVCESLQVPCVAEDLECPWKGTRAALRRHASVCAWVALRPVIEHLTTSYSTTIAQVASVTKENAELLATVEKLEATLQQALEAKRTPKGKT
ncbi:ICP0-binding domain of Ubiquitin-specific protease 7 [Pelomyxa schiedti]|nr:ICP0-binding domain of Ubiquitin-specific protease 7 [Pelomyxa schiedti]